MSLTVEGEPVDVALAGGVPRIDLDGRALPCPVGLTLRPGERLGIRAGKAGAWTTLAVAGRIAVAPVLGFTATHTRSGLGGLGGRGLRAGDALPVAEPRATIGEAAHLDLPFLHRPPDTIWVLLGPQDDHFAQAAIAAFLAGPWRVGARGDRFARVDLTEAAAARRAEAVALVPAVTRRPVVHTRFTSKFLLGTNLIDGVVG